MLNSVEELGKKLQDIDGNIRRRAVIDISRLPRLKAFPLLVQALDDPDDEVREAAIYGLADIKEPKALDYLLKPKVLFDENSNIRLCAVRALGNYRQIKGLPVITELLRLSRDSEWIVANTALSIIASEIEGIKNEGGQDAILSLIYILQLPDPEVCKKAIEALTEIGRNNLTTLMKSLSSTSNSVRASVVRVLGELRAVEAKGLLIELAEDKSKMVRKEVARSLGKIGGEEIGGPLLKLLGDICEDVRERARQAIVAQGENLLEALIIELSHTRYKCKQKAIVAALGEIASEKAVIPLINCLGSRYHVVRMAAVESLVKLHSPISIKDLQEVLVINPVDLRELINVAKDSTVVRLKIRAIRALGEIKDPGSISHLKELLDTGQNDSVAKEIVRALEKINESIWARVCALRFFGKIRDESSLPEIIKSLTDAEDLDVRYEALNTIAGMKAVMALDEIIKLADHPEAFMRTKFLSVLGIIGSGDERVRNILMEKLKDENGEVRAEAARSLGNSKDKTVIPCLIEAFEKDSFWSVRRHASFSLNKLGAKEYSL